MSKYTKYFLGITAFTALGLAAVASHVFFGYHRAYKKKDFHTMYEKSKIINNVFPENKQTLYDVVCSEILYKHIGEIESSKKLIKSRKLDFEWSQKLRKLNLKLPMPNQDMQDFYILFKNLHEGGIMLRDGVPHETKIWGDTESTRYNILKKSLPLLSKINSEESNYVASLYGAYIIKEHIYEISLLSLSNLQLFHHGRDYTYTEKDGNYKEFEEISEEIGNRKKLKLQYMKKAFSVLYNSLKLELKEINNYIRDGKNKTIYLQGAYEHIYNCIQNNTQQVTKSPFLLETEKEAIKNINIQLYSLTTTQKVNYELLSAIGKKDFINLEKNVKKIIQSYNKE